DAIKADLRASSEKIGAYAVGGWFNRFLDAFVFHALAKDGAFPRKLLSLRNFQRTCANVQNLTNSISLSKFLFSCHFAGAIAFRHMPMGSTPNSVWTNRLTRTASIRPSTS